MALMCMETSIYVPRICTKIPRQWLNFALHKYFKYAVILMLATIPIYKWPLLVKWILHSCSTSYIISGKDTTCLLD